MRRIAYLVREVLPRPVLVVFAIAPEAGGRDVIDQACIGYPYLFPVLTIAEGELCAGIGCEGVFHAFRRKPTDYETILSGKSTPIFAIVNFVNTQTIVSVEVTKDKDSSLIFLTFLFMLWIPTSKQSLMKKPLPFIYLFLTILWVSACEPAKNTKEEAADEEELRSHARELAQQYIITDGHVDLPYRLWDKMEDVSGRTEGGDFDYQRAKEGGLNAPFMSIYIPASYQETGGARALADSLIDMVAGITTDHPEQFAMAGSTATVEEQFAKGLISFPMGIENGAALEDDLANVQHFYNRGVRYITLTHSKDNLICDSSYDTARTHNGLSDYGREVVAEMNRVGIMVDVSHISDSTFWQVMELSKAPVIASHSSCRHFTPGFERNMDDEMIKKLAEKGGVIQINFGSTFISGESLKRWNKAKALVAEAGVEEDSPEADSIRNAYLTEYPVFTTVEAVADHIDHVVEIAGIDHVGFGSDFDGVGDSLPVGLKDVSDYPTLIYHLLKRGYSNEDIEKICYKNVWRVWNAVAKTAQETP